MYINGIFNKWELQKRQFPFCYGGVGTIPGVMIGAILMGILNQGMSIMGIDNNWQYIVKGAILLIAVIFDVVSNKKTSKT